MKRVPEKVVQKGVIALYEAFGCRVWHHSEPRAALVSVGYPDLTIFCPRRKARWYFEVKAKGGKLRPSQVAFKLTAESCGCTVLVGGLREAKDHLKRIGLALQ